MKRAFSSFVAMALVGAIAVPVMAQSVTNPSIATFNNGYLEKHPGIAQQLSQNPELLNNQQFLAAHPGLAGYLTKHPQLATELQQHPNRFMNAQSQYGSYGNSRGSVGSAVANFDNHYLDQHPEVAQQLSQNPGLVDNRQFVSSHPGLENYLSSHPQVRTDLQHNPRMFMGAESRFERHEQNGQNWGGGWGSHSFRNRWRGRRGW